MLMRFDPFADVRGRVPETGRRAPQVLPMDAYREGESVHVWLDIPGVKPENLDITVEKGVVTITAERVWHAGDEVTVIANERPQGTFTRQLQLGDNLDGDRLEASYVDGVLHLVIPVAEQAKPRKVAVKAGS
ncbi:MAG: Hsp20/alpha crystallin family protein [Actinomyces sp.]|nr:MAG: Hsp20/alpha crystallin family protein [Actinomyces sp.]